MDKKLYIYTPILIAAGVTQKYLYYQAFNLRILDYQEFSETLSLISESLVGLILIIPFTWYASFMLDLKKEHISQPENYEDLIESAHKEIKFAKRIGLYLLRYWGASFIITLLSILTFLMRFGFIRDVWLLESYLFALVLLVIFIILLLEFQYKYERIFEKKLDANTSMIFHYGGFIIILMTLFTYVEARGIKEGTFIVKDYKIEMVNGDFISTTKDLIYIGQTKNFLFVYDKSNDETSVINKKQIIKISIKKQKQTMTARTNVPRLSRASRS